MTPIGRRLAALERRPDAGRPGWPTITSLAAPTWSRSRPRGVAPERFEKRVPDAREKRLIARRPRPHVLNRAAESVARARVRSARRAGEMRDRQSFPFPPRVPVHQHAGPQQRRERRRRVEADVLRVAWETPARPCRSRSARRRRAGRAPSGSSARA